MAALPDADDWQKGDEDAISEIHNCYCPNCEGSNAHTFMLPTKVPMFREIYLMTLTCPDCNFKNSEVNFGGEIQVKGEKISLLVTSPDDLNRQLIKSDSASLFIPHLEFEIPAKTQRGTISTLEGVLVRAAENLEALQPHRLKLGDVDNFHRCRVVIKSLRKLAGRTVEDDSSDEEEEDNGNSKEGGFESFQIVLDDTAGNSFIENPHAPSDDPHMTREKYTRTPRQDMSLGLQPSKESIAAGTIDDANPLHKNVINDGGTGAGGAAASTTTGTGTTNEGTGGTGAGKSRGTITDGIEKLGLGSIGREEALRIPTSCAACHRDAETVMCVTDIPHFKEVVIMSLLCEHCGYKSNEIKGGGAIPKFGTKIVLQVFGPDDLAREILKSDTAGIEIPELELELDEGGLDGAYTTVEGLLDKLHKKLTAANPFGTGDSATKQHLSNDGGAFSKPSPSAMRYREFLAKLKLYQEGLVFPFSLVISDPLSNSFIGPIPADAIALTIQAEEEDSNECYKHYVDKGMIVEEYTRTFEQNEYLGLNDMKTENYQVYDNDDDEVNEAGEKIDKNVNHGTDQLEDLPDRLQRLDHRGPDHPHKVAKAPVEGDNTVMGEGSANFATPSLGQRGVVAKAVVEGEKTIAQIVEHTEKNDEEFIMCDYYDGSRPNMVFKYGKQGTGYYLNQPLMTLVENKL